jgi:hypothetical protein
VAFADQASTVSTITFWTRLAKKIGAEAEGGTGGEVGCRMCGAGDFSLEHVFSLASARGKSFILLCSYLPYPIKRTWFQASGKYKIRAEVVMRGRQSAQPTGVGNPGEGRGEEKDV